MAPKVNPNDILVWAQVGGTLVQIGRATIEQLRGAFSRPDNGFEADNAQLDRVAGLYAERIEVSERIANAPDAPDPLQ